MECVRWFAAFSLVYCIMIHWKQGCDVKDHVVELEEMEDGQSKGSKVYDDLLQYRHAIAVSVIPPKPTTQWVGVRDQGYGVLVFWFLFRVEHVTWSTAINKPMVL